MPAAKADPNAAKAPEVPDAPQGENAAPARPAAPVRQLSRAEREALRLRLFKKFHGRIA